MPRNARQVHHQCYTVYWKLLTRSEWDKEKASREAEAQELEAATDGAMKDAGIDVKIVILCRSDLRNDP
ncbi:MAG: hypothetical protein QF473_31470 [Planctomycetota bacterium]|jgi:hypothetical protein|nr:hypothetical protein [Planctomycetota bacterium]MDP6503630.1 hypothetical protein [Planctomycetota bacterium]